jgi:hypothetical protein
MKINVALFNWNEITKNKSEKEKKAIMTVEGQEGKEPRREERECNQVAS